MKAVRHNPDADVDDDFKNRFREFAAYLYKSGDPAASAIIDRRRMFVVGEMKKLSEEWQRELEPELSLIISKKRALSFSD